MLQARERMREARIRHLVVTEDARVVGIVTDRDIRLNLPSPATSLSVWEINHLLARLTVREIMSASVIVVDPDRPAAEAARLMTDHKIGALPVVDGTTAGRHHHRVGFRARGRGRGRAGVIDTILVVDDEHDLVVTCARLLKRRGWLVVTATTRSEALAALSRAAAPRLAIVDRQLADGDGLDVLRVALAAGTPVIVITGRASSEIRRLTLEAGAAGFLAKPFSAHDFLALVRAVVGDPAGSAMTLPPMPPGASPCPPRLYC